MTPQTSQTPLPNDVGFSVDLKLNIAGTAAVAAYEKALFLPEYQTLVVSDLHFGKAAHFRKNGIRVPHQADFDNLLRLDSLLARYPANRLLLAGDAFHSEENASVALFTEWRARYPNLAIDLIAGNHDVMATATYAKLGISQVGREARIGSLAIVHDPRHAGVDPSLYYLAGHVHPGAHLPSKAGGLKLPALILGEKTGLLPCFGAFTGAMAVDTKEAQQIVVFTGTRVFQLPTM